MSAVRFPGGHDPVSSDAATIPDDSDRLDTVSSRDNGPEVEPLLADDAKKSPQDSISSRSPRLGSQSLPRFAGGIETQRATGTGSGQQRKVDSLPGDLRECRNHSDREERDASIERRKKSKGMMRTLGNLVQKVARQITSVSSLARSKIRQPDDGAGDSDKIESEGAGSEEGKAEVGDKVPGVIGIHNHGNTCYMNAVLQCLSNTERLLVYFITDQYKDDIKRSNKHNSKRFGTHGELTESLASLLRCLWKCTYTSDVSLELKSCVSKHGTQYRGAAQHDAQEFLMWLLDKVHEDLNIASKKKYRANRSSFGRSDEDVAAEALANHARCNHSFIYDIFQASYRSSLTCPSCSHRSNTFDPFLSVSLPIPHKTRVPVCITVLRFSDVTDDRLHAAVQGEGQILAGVPAMKLEALKDSVGLGKATGEVGDGGGSAEAGRRWVMSEPVIKWGFLMDQEQLVKDVRKALSEGTGLSLNSLLLFELDDEGFGETFSDNQSVYDLCEIDSLYAIQVTPTSASDTAEIKPASQSLETEKATQQNDSTAEYKETDKPVTDSDNTTDAKPTTEDKSESSGDKMDGEENKKEKEKDREVIEFTPKVSLNREISVIVVNKLDAKEGEDCGKRLGTPYMLRLWTHSSMSEIRESINSVIGLSNLPSSPSADIAKPGISTLNSDQSQTTIHSTDTKPLTNGSSEISSEDGNTNKTGLGSGLKGSEAGASGSDKTPATGGVEGSDSGKTSEQGGTSGTKELKISAGELNKYRIQVLNDYETNYYLDEESERPLCNEIIDNTIENSISGCGHPYLKVLLVWHTALADRFQTAEGYIWRDVEVKDDESIGKVKVAQQQTVIGTLDECFQFYTQEERLDADNAWLCPSCRKYQQGALKSLNLWTLPDILVIHLKRFRQDASQRAKLNTLITFPVKGLDLKHNIMKSHGENPAAASSSSYLTQQNTQRGGAKLLGGSGAGGSGNSWLSWKPGRKVEDSTEDYVYDLYGVCNHYGNMHSGHYTAFCKNPASGQWYSFNDSRATEMREQEIVTRNAYLIFYERRASAPSRPQEGSAAGGKDLRQWLEKLKLVESIPRAVTSQSLDDLLDGDVERKSAVLSTDDLDPEPAGDESFRAAIPIYTVHKPPPRITRHSSFKPAPSHSSPSLLDDSTNDSLSNQKSSSQNSTGDVSQGSDEMNNSRNVFGDVVRQLDMSRDDEEEITNPIKSEKIPVTKTTSSITSSVKAISAKILTSKPPVPTPQSKSKDLVSQTKSTGAGASFEAQIANDTVEQLSDNYTNTDAVATKNGSVQTISIKTSLSGSSDITDNKDKKDLLSTGRPNLPDLSDSPRSTPSASPSLNASRSIGNSGRSNRVINLAASIASSASAKISAVKKPGSRDAAKTTSAANSKDITSATGDIDSADSYAKSVKAKVSSLEKTNGKQKNGFSNETIGTQRTSVSGAANIKPVSSFTSASASYLNNYNSSSEKLASTKVVNGQGRTLFGDAGLAGGTSQGESRVNGAREFSEEEKNYLNGLGGDNAVMFRRSALGRASLMESSRSPSRFLVDERVTSRSPNRTSGSLRQPSKSPNVSTGSRRRGSNSPQTKVFVTSGLKSAEQLKNNTDNTDGSLTKESNTRTVISKSIQSRLDSGYNVSKISADNVTINSSSEGSVVSNRSGNLGGSVSVGGNLKLWGGAEASSASGEKSASKQSRNGQDGSEVVSRSFRASASSITSNTSASSSDAVTSSSSSVSVARPR